MRFESSRGIQFFLIYIVRFDKFISMRFGALPIRAPDVFGLRAFPIGLALRREAILAMTHWIDDGFPVDKHRSAQHPLR